MSKAKKISVQYWLAELDQYGNATLVDGAHSSAEGVQRARDLFRHLGFDRDRKFACAKVELTEVEPQPVIDDNPIAEIVRRHNGVN